MILIIRKNATTKMKASINRFLNIDHLYFHDFILFFLIHFFCLTFSPFWGGGCFLMVTRGQQMIASHISTNVLQLKRNVKTFGVASINILKNS